MSPILSIGLFILALASLIVVHELGHFLAAKLCRIKVLEFGIGFPPRMARLFTIGGTEFTLNWIPLGGFVRPSGENDPTIPGGLAAANPWARIFVLLAGPAANILTAIILYAIIFMQIGKPDLSVVRISDVSTSSPAAEAGLLPGDLITEVGGEPINSTEELHTLIYDNLGQPLEFTYSRDGVLNTVVLTPRNPAPADGAIGIAMGHPLLPISPVEAVSVGFSAITEQARALIELPGRLISGQASPEEGRLVGYKGMYDIYTEVREADSAPDSGLPAGVNTLNFFASISVSLGVLNLLPIPALDGGRILFTLPELIFRRRVPQAFENVVNALGLALLLLLMFYVNIQDFLNPVAVP